MFHDLIFDDAELIQYWVATIIDPATSLQMKKTIKAILKSIECVSPHVWKALLKALHSGPSVVREILLNVVARLVNRNHLDDSQWQEFVKVAGQLDKTQIGSICYQKLGLEAYVDALFTWLSTIKDLHDAESLCQSYLTYVKQYCITTMSEILTYPQDSMRKAFVELAKNNIYVFKEYRTRYAKATEARIHSNPKLLIPLILTLNGLLSHGVCDGFEDDGLRHELLCTLAACSQHLPIAFAYFTHFENSPIANSITDLESNIAIASRMHNTYTGRSAALYLLGMLAHSSSKTVKAIYSALLDVDDVRTAAMTVSSNLHLLPKGILKNLF